MSIEAMKQALEALKLAVMQNEHDMLMTSEELHKCVVAGVSLSQAIAEAEKQNPVADMYRNKCADGSRCLHGCHTSERCYHDTHPQPKREPLTDGQINARAKEEGAHNADFWAGVRFAEAAHGIKENT